MVGSQVDEGLWKQWPSHPTEISFFAYYSFKILLKICPVGLCYCTFFAGVCTCSCVASKSTFLSRRSGFSLPFIPWCPSLRFTSLLISPLQGFFLVTFSYDKDNRRRPPPFITLGTGTSGSVVALVYDYTHDYDVFMCVLKSANAELVWRLAIGFCAGTFGSLLNLPFDVAKSRIQGPQPQPGVVKYSKCLATIATVYREEG